MLGGAAVHFALAASFFDEVRVVGPVGEDFGETELDVLRHRGVDITDIERVPGGKTFFWRGKYGWDLNSRETLDTQLGVFEGFQPKLSEASRASEVLFLANIQPDLQREVRAQLPDARFVALDSMNLWIEAARDSLVRAIAECDCLILNDSELRQLTGKASLYAAAREILAWSPPHPRVIVAKQGEYGAALVTAGGFFSLPPSRWSPSWTPPARATRSRGASSGTSPLTPRRRSPTICCARRWPTAPRWPPSTSKSSAPSASRTSPGRRSSRACASCASSPSSPPRAVPLGERPWTAGCIDWRHRQLAGHSRRVHNCGPASSAGANAGSY